MGHKRKLILFTAFMTVAVAVICAFLIKSTEPQTITVTDNDGVTYVAIIDQHSEIYAGVTDANGNVYAAKIENGVVMKDHPLYVVDNYDGTFPANNTTRGDNINIDQSENTDFDFTGEAVTKASKDVNTETSEFTVSGDDTTKKKEEGTTKKNSPEPVKNPEEYKAYRYMQLFNSGIFAMTFTTDDPDLSEDITMAMRNGSIYMDTTMEGISCKVVYDADKKIGYMVIPQMRVYCLMPEDLIGEMSTTEFNMQSISEATGVDVSEVTIDGKDCICEEFIFGEKETRSFYFYNDNLVRMTETKDGETVVYNIKKLTSNVDSSYFEVPKGYLKVDLSWLEAQEG